MPAPVLERDALTAADSPTSEAPDREGDRNTVPHAGAVKRRVYDRIARLYDVLDLPFERRRYRPARRVLFEGVGGAVLDAGVGTGRNMAFYPPGAEVVGIDLSPAMLARARRRREALGLSCDLRLMDATATDFPAARFDYVIATFLFCVLDDELQLPALRELRRVLKPTGELRIIEYAYSRDPVRRFIMRLWAPWVRFAYGAAFDRDTERYVDAAGLELVERRFLYEDIIKLLILRPRSEERRDRKAVTPKLPRALQES